MPNKVDFLSFIEIWLGVVFVILFIEIIIPISISIQHRLMKSFQFTNSKENRLSQRNTCFVVSHFLLYSLLTASIIFSIEFDIKYSLISSACIFIIMIMKLLRLNGKLR
jgi:Na+/H+ antiporter NhaD/arsenite permease-like protein